MSKKKQKSIEELLEEALVPEEEQPYKVPENWVWVRLKHLVDFFSGSAFPNQYQGYNDLEIPFYKVGNLKDTDSNYYIYSEENTISEEIRVKLKAKKVPKDTILFAKIGEAIRLNRRGLVPKPACIDNNLMGFKANENILDNKLLLYWSLKEDFYKYSQATAVPSIRKSTLEAISFPLPPIHEQKRIAEKVERLFAKIDEAKRLIEEVKESFELRRAAILDKAFRGELTAKWRTEHKDLLNNLPFNEKCNTENNLYSLPRGWKWVEIGDIADVKGGKRLPKGHSLVKENTGYPYIKAGNLKNGTVLQEELEYLEFDTWEAIKNYTVAGGDVYITIVGACIGDVGIIPNELNGANLTENAAKIFNLKNCNNEFIAFWLSSPVAQNIIKSKISSAAQGKLALSRIKTINVPIPPIEEQEQIVSIIKKALSKEEESKSVLNLQKKIDDLKQTILNKAFHGELGTNDPTDEHAIELLKEVIKSK
jgi:type I restriction enzyme, S subunit